MTCRILVPQKRIQLETSALEAHSPNHRATREVLPIKLKKKIIKAISDNTDQ